MYDILAYGFKGQIVQVWVRVSDFQEAPPTFPRVTLQLVEEVTDCSSWCGGFWPALRISMQTQVKFLQVFGQNVTLVTLSLAFLFQVVNFDLYG